MQNAADITFGMLVGLTCVVWSKTSSCTMHTLTMKIACDFWISNNFNQSVLHQDGTLIYGNKDVGISDS